MERIAAFEVLEHGILTTVQDLGRYGFSQFGVPPSGASDLFSLKAGNLLVGNRAEDASLETMVMGLKLKTLSEVVIAITGGDLFPTLNGEPLTTPHVKQLEIGPEQKNCLICWSSMEPMRTRRQYTFCPSRLAT